MSSSRRSDPPTTSHLQLIPAGVAIPPRKYYQFSNITLALTITQGVWRGSLLRSWELVGGGSRDELLDGLRAEVLEDSFLPLYPGVVQGAWSALSAGAILHNAADDGEWPFDRIYGFQKRYLVRGSGKPGTSAAALFGLDETRVGELGQDASEQAAGNVGFGGDPVGGHPLTDPGKIHQSPPRLAGWKHRIRCRTGGRCSGAPSRGSGRGSPPEPQNFHPPPLPRQNP